MPKSKEGKFIPTFGTKTSLNKPTNSAVRPNFKTKQKPKISCNYLKQNSKLLVGKANHAIEKKNYNIENNFQPNRVSDILEKQLVNENIRELKNISKNQNEKKLRKVKEHNFDNLFSSASFNVSQESSKNLQNKLNSTLVKNSVEKVSTFEKPKHNSTEKVAKKIHNFDELFSSANDTPSSKKPEKHIKCRKHEQNLENSKNSTSINTSAKKKHNFDELFSSANGSLSSKKPEKQIKPHKFDNMFSSARFDNEDDDFLPPPERKTITKKRKQPTGQINKKVVKKPNLFDELFSSASKAGK